MKGVKMYLTAVLLQAVYIVQAQHDGLRRSLSAPSHSLSKGGWKPVIGNIGVPSYALLNASPVAVPHYNDVVYGATQRPITARDSNKLTSIAQSYKPTSMPTNGANFNAPVHSYVNPFSGQSHYKVLQNYQQDNLLRQHRPQVKLPVPIVLPNRFKANQIQAMMQQLGVNQYAIAQGYKEQDLFSKPVDAFVRTSGNTKDKTSVGSKTAGKQQVKTAQQVLASTNKPTVASTVKQQQYGMKNEYYTQLPSGVLGNYAAFGMPVKLRDQNVSPSKTTYIPTSPTRHMVFNSFSYTPAIKYTPEQYQQTTPKLIRGQNQILYNTYGNEVKPPVGKFNSFKVDQKQVPSKTHFKASAHDPFHKQVAVLPTNQYYYETKVKKPHDLYTYYTTIPSQIGVGLQNVGFGNQVHYAQQPLYPTIPTTQQHNQNYAVVQQTLTKPQTLNNYNQHQVYTTPNTVPFRATYEVTELWPGDAPTQKPWLDQVTPFNVQNEVLSTETTPETLHDDYSVKPITTTTSEPEILTQYTTTEDVNKYYDNSLKHYSDNETPPSLSLDEEVHLDSYAPEKHNIENYYYKVTTPSYDATTYRGKQKLPETNDDVNNDEEVTTVHESLKDESHLKVEALPTLAPHKHYKRPHAPHKTITSNNIGEKDKQRKRNKTRRRRPPSNDVVSTRPTYSTENKLTDEVNATNRPRVRPFKKPRPTQSTEEPVTTPLPTSVIPIIRKSPLRHSTTPAPTEATSTLLSSKESSIMKINNRPQSLRTTTIPNDYSNETPDYSHKQDEKDTPTSDISINTPVIGKGQRGKDDKRFSFHADAKPIEPVSEDSLAVERLPTTSEEDDSNVKPLETTTDKPETTSQSGKQRPRIKINKYDANRPRFSIKDYRNRLSSTTTTERSTDSQTPRLRFPQRRLPTGFTSDKSNLLETSTDQPRKKFIPKDPRHKQPLDAIEIDMTTTERQTNTPTYPDVEETTRRHSARIRNGARRDPARVKSTTEATIEAYSSPSPVHIKRPLRKKVTAIDSLSEQSQDNIVTEVPIEGGRETTSERYKSESAIMKIAKDKHHYEESDNSAEQSKRVSDLTLAGNKDYSKPGLFKTVSPISRKVPSYFTIATDDPILPIEAFFPQLNQKKDS